MFNTILIANRGEIACRIIKTAQSMGIKTVAVYSSVDKDAMHVQSADSAYYIGEAPAKDSYLHIESIIQAAKDSGAQAIHPGYGFLSENPEFAKACAKANIIFIGPSVHALEVMASKQVAKQILEKTKVPLTPGYHGGDQSEKKLLAEAKKIGFPILIKAANGGGGKGMRSVFEEKDFTDALHSAKRESKASFADDTVILEKLVQNPRHVEIQIMADTHGQVVHLFERDCSIQRRHQKIIEEAPAPNLSPSMRNQLAKAACEVAKQIGYLGAGTVEFLVDGEDHFYFMEMNTRLQVEHPVTEMITGLDLVAWQLKIASNEPLPLKQEEIKESGHAIECRIYAEDPYSDFIPSIGTINFLQEPTGTGIRIDTGVRLNSEITMYYDPMIAKLITWGDTREEALHRMQQALSHYYIGGVKSNIAFLKAICQHPAFMNAQLTTNFLSQEKVQLKSPDDFVSVVLAVGYDYLNVLSKIKDPLEKESFAWQMLGSGHWIWRYLIADKSIEAKVSPINDNEFKVCISDKEELIAVKREDNAVYITQNQHTIKAIVHVQDNTIALHTEDGAVVQLQRYLWNKLDAQSSGHKGQLTAPMPATVVAILKNKGEPVKAGDRLIVLEAMKMEHTIHAPADGILLDVYYAVGAQVREGAELLSMSES